MCQSFLAKSLANGSSTCPPHLCAAGCWMPRRGSPACRARTCLRFATTRRMHSGMVTSAGDCSSNKKNQVAKAWLTAIERFILHAKRCLPSSLLSPVWLFVDLLPICLPVLFTSFILVFVVSWLFWLLSRIFSGVSLPAHVSVEETWGTSGRTMKGSGETDGSQVKKDCETNGQERDKHGQTRIRLKTSGDKVIWKVESKCK